MSPATTTTTTGPGGRKSVLVTGGGSGIGLAMARHFASEGHLVAVLDVNAASGAKVVADLAAEFPAATIAFKKCDVTSWTDQAKVFAEVYEEHGARLDVVMANAGISEQGGSSSVDLTEETPSEPRLGAINVNLVGVVYCEYLPSVWGRCKTGRGVAQLTIRVPAVKLAAHYMNKGKATSGASSRGSIICTSSNAGLYGFPIAPLYAASKAGVIGLVRSLAKPLAKANIQINALAPAVIGKFKSPFQSVVRR